MLRSYVSTIYTSQQHRIVHELSQVDLVPNIDTCVESNDGASIFLLCDFLSLRRDHHSRVLVYSRPLWHDYYTNYVVVLKVQ